MTRDARTGTAFHFRMFLACRISFRVMVPDKRVLDYSTRYHTGCTRYQYQILQGSTTNYDVELETRE